MYAVQEAKNFTATPKLPVTGWQWRWWSRKSRLAVSLGRSNLSVGVVVLPRGFDTTAPGPLVW